jgi:alpha-L-fucosidase
LYAQNHVPGKKLVWDWNPAQGSSVPDAAYMEKFFKRVQQLWDDYNPDMIYFDDDVLPLHGVTDEIGLNLLAHFYNSNIRRHHVLFAPKFAPLNHAGFYDSNIHRHHAKNEAVVTDKHLNTMERHAQVYDIERGKAEGILPQPWQTDTCIGSWHYDRAIFEQHRYKTAAMVIPMLADIVSKNGNLMLSVPLQRDGTPDSDEIKIVKEIGAWLKINGKAIYATRPWKIYGEGPSTTAAEKGRFDGQSDVQKKPFTPEDIRFTQSKNGKTLYAIVLAIPTDGKINIKSLATDSPDSPEKIRTVRLLGGGKLEFAHDASGLHVRLPSKLPGEIALALAIGH